MDTRVLETFLLVAECGGLSSAASVLGVPQSQVSRHIKEIEQACGAPLLYRHGRGVRLTVTGESMRDALRPLLVQLQDVLANAAVTDRVPSGPVNIALSPSIIRSAGLRLLDEMAQRYPEVKLHLVSGYSRFVYEWVLSGQVDIGVLSDAGISSQLLLEELGTAPAVLAARAGFDLPPSEQVTRKLPNLPLVLPGAGQGLRRHVDAWAARRGIRLQVTYEIDDVDLTREIMADGRAAGIVSRLSIMRELKTGAFIARPLDADFRLRTVMATARNRPITPAMKASIGVIKAVATDLFAAL
jgi:LysR family transcriptional regulator, nitrogen assimilation regulatory protein